MTLDAINGARHLAEIRRRRAGDSGNGHVIDEAGGVGEDRRQALVVGGRRGQSDEGEARRQRRQAEFLILLGRQVDDDQAIDAGRLGIGQEAVDAIDIDRVVIAHQDDRRVGIAAMSPSPLRKARPGRACVPASRRPAAPAATESLDRRPVRHRIGEGHAELDDVGARAAGRPRRMASEVPPSGSPAVTKVTSAARPCAAAQAETGIDARGHRWSTAGVDPVPWRETIGLAKSGMRFLRRSSIRVGRTRAMVKAACATARLFRRCVIITRITPQ